MLDFILSKIAFWGFLGLPFVLITRWLFRTNSAALGLFGYLLITYLVLTVLQICIDDWEALCIQRKARKEDGRKSSEEGSIYPRASAPVIAEAFVVQERGWNMLKRRQDPL
jgi:hypothetical protein